MNLADIDLLTAEEHKQVADYRLRRAAPDLLAALRVGLYHTKRAASLSLTMQSLCDQKGMHGSAGIHESNWQDAERAAEMIRTAITKATGEQF